MPKTMAMAHNAAKTASKALAKKGKQRMMHLKKIDTNQDQQISLEEAEAGNAEKLVEHFQTIDTNGDGVLTKDELKAHGQTIREQRKQEREAQGQ